MIRRVLPWTREYAAHRSAAMRERIDTPAGRALWKLYGLVHNIEKLVHAAYTA